MPPRLQIQPEKCSPLGRLVLQYMKEHDVSMREIARLAGISQPGLRSVCLGTYPTDSTLQKLAQALGKPPLELYNLAYGRKVEKFQEDIDSHSSDEALVQELFAIAKKVNLAAPTTIPSKTKIRRALMELGFSSTN